ncbi:unnamed protein product [Protopolystoma xenopodis]|uniref:Uncharacterized protein n=1 Tax=Protopolystoma xenopodis TaxID=117903 RepID=A0A448XQY1_9PLAT|nr:unnamed protein product [Protopolystoma xenopodis]
MSLVDRRLDAPVANIQSTLTCRQSVVWADDGQAGEKAEFYYGLKGSRPFSGHHFSIRPFSGIIHASVSFDMFTAGGRLEERPITRSRPQNA